MIWSRYDHGMITIWSWYDHDMIMIWNPPVITVPEWYPRVRHCPLWCSRRYVATTGHPSVNINVISYNQLQSPFLCGMIRLWDDMVMSWYGYEMIRLWDDMVMRWYSNNVNGMIWCGDMIENFKHNSIQLIAVTHLCSHHLCILHTPTHCPPPPINLYHRLPHPFRLFPYPLCHYT